MFSPTDAQCLLILQAATEATFGLVVRTNNPAKARQTLYRVRKDFGDPAFADIQVRVSPDNSEGEIWLLRKTKVSAPTFDMGVLGA